jgi:hypothetical protein
MYKRCLETYIQFTEDIVITHNHGFFSNCNIILETIINYFNKYKILPTNVDTSESFDIYKPDHLKHTDIMNHFFVKDNISSIQYNQDIQYNHNFQFVNYKTIDYNSLNPFINKYFKLNDKINSIVTQLTDKYNIDTDNYIAIYYRGTDKYIETTLGDFIDYEDKLKLILSDNPTLKILLLTDSKQAYDYFNTRYNITFITENKTSSTHTGIHLENDSNTNYNDIKNFLATIFIISKCKYIICSSGNCSLFTMFFRNNANNVYQFLNEKWYT